MRLFLETMSRSNGLIIVRAVYPIVVPIVNQISMHPTCPNNSILKANQNLPPPPYAKYEEDPIPNKDAIASILPTPPSQQQQHPINPPPTPRKKTNTDPNPNVPPPATVPTPAPAPTPPTTPIHAFAKFKKEIHLSNWHWLLWENIFGGQRMKCSQ